MLRTSAGGIVPAAATADRQLLSIGAVLNLLRDEFPEVTISKIRFLETEGLVEPQRTPSGYRKFSAKDVDRLAHVLRMQRDHYLPLKVIREHLDALDRGDPVPVPAPAGARSGALAEEPAGELLEPEADAAAVVRLGRAELVAAAGVTEEQLGEWESYGVVQPNPDGTYSGEMLAITKIVAEMRRFGLEPRHLRAVRAAAEREVGLVEQVVAPLRRHRNPQTRAHAEAMARELATLSVRLHAALVQSGLRVRML
ncbi:MerR family transcriptional regulator [Wenjunlia vitaminophila]|uniref:MerR family transcriptional regulator n=1 Tax=Wenjunlia vitaminophila TaxID=76728 RepID=A0A0T6LQ09_WENVI|nr:MerR family transcriptional regulator [Wenjunlia vitaminophila]KRV47951.1 MerR family transcriptional regulator [Wenjunlia vitaminophila]